MISTASRQDASLQVLVMMMIMVVQGMNRSHRLYLCIYLSVNLSIYPSTKFPLQLVLSTIQLSIHLSFYPSSYLSIQLPICAFIYPSVHSLTHLSTYLCIYISINTHLCIYLLSNSIITCKEI